MPSVSITEMLLRTSPATGTAPDPRAVIGAGTGRTVWASRGNVALAGTGPNRPYVPTLLPAAPGRPVAADWAAVRPAAAPADDVTFADRREPEPPAAREVETAAALAPVLAALGFMYDRLEPTGAPAGRPKV